MGLRLRQHSNPLKLQNQLPRAARLTAPQGSEVEVEIGCGEARFLIERAVVAPGAVLVGVEIRPEVVELAQKRVRDAGAPVTLIATNANVDLCALFAEGQLTRAYVNFPDPWFKRRHHKRRVVTPQFAREMVSRLRPRGPVHVAGELFFQSDVWETALDAMSVLEGETGLVNVHGAWTFARVNTFGARSDRETWCEDRNKPIWRILYRRVG